MKAREPKAVWLVESFTHYECSDALAVFAAKSDADAFAETCRAYEATYPKCPDGDYDRKPKTWERYWSVERAWRAAHPGGADAGGSDGFTVRTLPFVEKQGHKR